MSALVHLAVLALMLALGAAPAAAPEEVFQQAVAAHEAGDFAGCERHFARAGELAGDRRLAPRAWFGAAACAARAGSANRAFGHLDRAVAHGFRDTAKAAAHPDLGGLRQDARWAGWLARVEERQRAHEATLDQELLRLYREDQADRAGGPDGIDWTVVAPRDAQRRARVRAILATGPLRTAEDNFHAAIVLQHGEDLEDYALAHELAARAAELDPAHPSARWLAAAAKDRWLMNQGKPQLYGTQFTKEGDKWVLWKVDPAVTDEERARWDVPPLAESRQQAERLNAPAKP